MPGPRRAAPEQPRAAQPRGRHDHRPRSRPQRPRAAASLRPARPQGAAEPGALQASCPARSLALVPVASPMVLPGIPNPWGAVSWLFAAVAPRTKTAAGRRRAAAGGSPGDTAPCAGHRPPPPRAPGPWPRVTASPSMGHRSTFMESA